MDFLDPKKKRAYNIRLFIGFILIGIVLILATVILAFITAGYSINRKTGEVFQNGLLFINAQPTAANIYLNSKFDTTTNARLELPAGIYNIELKANKYNDWSNSVNLLGGTVTKLIYPFLFPTKPVVSNPLIFATQPDIVTQTPDRQWILSSVPGSLGSFNIVNANTPATPVSTAAIPATALNAQPGTNTLSVVQWSTDNQHVLLKDTYSTGVQYIIFNWTNPSDSYNISQIFATTAFTSIRMQNNVFSKLYLYDQATLSLSLGDLLANTVTPVLSNVLAYWPYSDSQIVYTTPDVSQPSEVVAKLWNTGTSYILKDLPAGSSYQLNIATYNGNSYVVINSSASNYAYIYQNVISQLQSNPKQLPLPYTLMVIDGSPENVSFSTSAGIIELQSGSQFAIYDIDNQSHFRYDTGLTIPQGELANWMDGNRLDIISANKLVIWDFDNTNYVTFANDAFGYMPDFNGPYSAVYTVNPIAGSPTGAWTLMRNSLIAGQQ